MPLVTVPDIYLFDINALVSGQFPDEGAGNHWGISESPYGGRWCGSRTGMSSARTGSLAARPRQDRQSDREGGGGRGSRRQP